MQRKIKVGWVLLGNETVGSSRIHAINVHNNLNREQFHSTIIKSPSLSETKLNLSFKKQLYILLKRLDILIFQKVFDKDAQRLARIASCFGVKTIFLQSDLIETNMTTCVDHVVTCSSFLRDALQKRHPGLQTKFTVIDDSLEHDTSQAKRHLPKTDLNIVWVGHSDNWHTLDIINRVLLKLNDSTIHLTTISNHESATYKWDKNTVYELILKNDIAVIPSTNDDWSKSKSSNRLTLFMSAGLPVIAWPVPAYEEIILASNAGFLAENIDQWYASLIKLRDHRLRQHLSSKGRRYALKNYSTQAIIKQWEDCFYKLSRKKRARIGFIQQHKDTL